MNSRRQPHRLPPPLDHGAETLDSAPILDEFPNDLGLLLWKSVRNTRLWARLAEEERREAFSPGAHEQRLTALRATPMEPAVLANLEVVASTLANEPVEGAVIARACREIATWAEAAGMLGTAVEFMQAAAFADPLDASLARGVGLLTRGRAEYARSETWFRHAIATARRTRAWVVFVRSYLGLGHVFILRGNYAAARKAFLRGLHAAVHRSNRELIASANHELAMLSGRMDRPNDLTRYARAALEHYPAGHPRLPALSHDVAVFWMTRGYFAQALQVFRGIPRDVGTPVDRLMRAAAVVRAAGAVGDREQYSEGWRDATRLLRNPATAQGAATALINLARGASSIGDAERAQDTIERALELARERSETVQVMAAEALRDSLRQPVLEPVRMDAERRPPRQVAHLARELATAMAPLGPSTPVV